MLAQRKLKDDLSHKRLALEELISQRRRDLRDVRWREEPDEAVAISNRQLFDEEEKLFDIEKTWCVTEKWGVPCLLI